MLIIFNYGVPGVDNLDCSLLSAPHPEYEQVDITPLNGVQPVADALIKEVAKAAKDSLTEVIRSGDFLSYTAEEGVRFLGEGELLVADSFPGQDRNKLCLSQKVRNRPLTCHAHGESLGR